MDDKYESLLELLMKAELAARNKEWATCGTYSRRAMELAFKYNNELSTLSTITPDLAQKHPSTGKN